MKDILEKLIHNRGRLCDGLAAIDENELHRGQLVLNQTALGALLSIFEDEKLRLDSVRVGQNGIEISLTYDKMLLSYLLDIKNLSVSGGNASGEIRYEEKRQGGGIGGALLGITGRNGIAFLLSGRKWCRADNSSIKIQCGGLPNDMYVKYTGIKQGALCFRVG